MTSKRVTRSHTRSHPRSYADERARDVMARVRNYLRRVVSATPVGAVRAATVGIARADAPDPIAAAEFVNRWCDIANGR